VDINGRHDTVSLDRLKPAYTEHPLPISSEQPTVLTTPQPTSPPSTSESAPSTRDSTLVQPSTPSTEPPISGRATRSGRRVHWPRHLDNFVP